MDDMRIIFPDKLFITFQMREAGETRLGFASPYANDKAFEKRKDTQIRWAYGRYYPGRDVVRDKMDDPDSTKSTTTFLKYNEQDGKVYKNVLVEYFKKGNLVKSEPIVVDGKAPDEIQPAIIDNVALDGFEIDKEVKRYGWNGGNVVWRIKDPRGFALEISSANLGRMIDFVTIEAGKIKQRCIWGRMGAVNVLIPEGSEYFENAVKNTKISKMEKISLRDVNVGDEILLKDGKTGIYLGKYFTLRSGFHSKEELYCVKFNIVNEKYLIKITDLPKELKKLNGKYEYWAYSSPTVKEIIKKVETPLSKEQIADEVNAYLKNVNMIEGLDASFYVSPTKIDASKIEINLRPMTIEEAATYLSRDKNSGKIVPASVNDHPYIKKAWPILFRNGKFLSIERFSFNQNMYEAPEISTRASTPGALIYVTNYHYSDRYHLTKVLTKNTINFETITEEDHWYVVALNYNGKEIIPNR